MTVVLHPTTVGGAKEQEKMAKFSCVTLKSCKITFVQAHYLWKYKCLDTIIMQLQSWRVRLATA